MLLVEGPDNIVIMKRIKYSVIKELRNGREVKQIIDNYQHIAAIVNKHSKSSTEQQNRLKSGGKACKRTSNK